MTFHDTTKGYTFSIKVRLRCKCHEKLRVVGIEVDLLRQDATRVMLVPFEDFILDFEFSGLLLYVDFVRVSINVTFDWNYPTSLGYTAWGHCVEHGALVFEIELFVLLLTLYILAHAQFAEMLGYFRSFLVQVHDNAATILTDTNSHENLLFRLGRTSSLSKKTAHKY